MSNKIKCAHILVEKQSQALQLLEDIKSGNYPEDKHLIKMDLSEFEKFQSKIK